MTDAHLHDAFDHVAVLHDGPLDLAAQLEAWLPAQLASDDTVLVCLDAPSALLVRKVVDDHTGPVLTTDPDLRYTRPSLAMRSVHEAVQHAVRDGAARVWSIGRIDFTDDDDGRWTRYEAAVDDVLGHLPLVGVCAYDTKQLPDDVIDDACRTHRHLHRAAGPIAPSYAPAVVGRWKSPSWLPASPATVEVDVSPVADSRAAAADLAAAAGFSTERISHVQLVATELATNAIRHGAPPATLRLWHEPQRVVIQAIDHGPGYRDPWPDLRPPDSERPGGYGFWIMGQLVDRIHLGRHSDQSTAITVAIDES